MALHATPIIIRRMGVCDYQSVWTSMIEFTEKRSEATPDEIWLLQHNPVFTQGQAGKPEHLLSSSDIPVVKSDRGGQITYHGPGQLIAYVLIDLRRKGLSVRQLVSTLEDSVVKCLANFKIQAYAKEDAPGVYVDRQVDGHALGDAKIASLGLRVRKGCCFHGLSLNIAMDLSPFDRINPCGYKGLAMTSMERLLLDQSPSFTEVEDNLATILKDTLHSTTQ